MKVLAIILAGGKRTDLLPLVEQRCKAAVPIFGKYRIIDFTLSNLINSGIRHIDVMVQYKFDSLQKHIRDGWNFLSPVIGEYIDVYPPQQREGERWYLGTADAIYQNLYSIENTNPDHCMVIHGDHITQIDYRNLISHHIEKNADLTITAISQEPRYATLFGNLIVDEESGKLKKFYEKPKEIKGTRDKQGNVFINAGVYLFKTQKLIEELKKDAKDNDSQHNISKNIIPKMIKEKKKIYTYHYKGKNNAPYNWNFFLNLDYYYETNMNILNPNWDEIDLNNPNWPIRTYQSQNSPTHIIVSNDKEGEIINCSIGSGCEIAGTLKNCILGNNVIIEKNATVEDSILFNNVLIEKNAKVKNAILDKKVLIKENHSLGYNLESDKSNFHISENGIVVVGKGGVV